MSVGFHRVQRRCCGSTSDTGRARAVSASARSDSGQTYSVQEKIFTVQGLCMLCVYVVLCFAQPHLSLLVRPCIQRSIQIRIARAKDYGVDALCSGILQVHTVVLPTSRPLALLYIQFNDRVMAHPFLFGALIPGPLGVTLCHRRNHT